MKEFYVIAVFLVLQSCSCSQDSAAQRSIADGSIPVASDMSVQDANTIEELPSLDVRQTDMRVGSSVEVDFSEFELTRPCGADRDLPPASTAEFQVPERPTGDPIPTRSNLVERLGEPLPVVHGLLPDPKHQPGSGVSSDLWANYGDEVSIHVAFGFPRDEGLETFRFNIVAMVDYQPVEASYIRWDDERQSKLEEIVSTGARYEMERDVEIIEIVFPADTFPEPRAYELGISYEVTNRSQALITGMSRRLMLYYGGFHRGAAPCVPSILSDNAQKHEAELRNRFVGFDNVFLAYDGMPRDRETPVRIAPGTTIKFLASHFRLSHQLVPSMIQPILNGRPVGESHLLAYGAAGGGFPQTIDARTTFDVTFPEEPGEYEVLVMTWPHAYELARTPEGEVNPDVDISPNHENSNPLHLIVDDSL